MGERLTIHLADETGASTGEVQIIDTRTLDDAKDEARARLDAEYAARYEAGCVVTVAGQAKPYQIDPDSQRLISGAALDAFVSKSEGGWPAGFYWIAADNTNQPMTADDCIAFGRAIKTYVAELVYANRALKNAIAALITIPDCDAFDVTQGWPGNG